MAEDLGHASLQALVEMKIECSIAAMDDLSRIGAFLTEHHPSISERLASEIDRRIDLIRDHPNVGRVIDPKSPVREIALTVLKGVYILQYRTTDTRIVILRVFRGRENRR